ncbi:MAG: hypothetical protein JO257_07520 [Deltaproteobacteria bacterium]|nr:hypothetical protein [Deltaproteobacteria bacterium]
MTKLLGALLILPAIAHADPKPCQAPELEQLAFWVGDWDATWPGDKGKPEQHGHNRIERVLDGCAFEEHFTGPDGFAGTSLSSWAPRTGWRQTWVDNQAAFMDFTGGKQGDGFVFGRDTTKPDGTKLKQRMVFKNITHDAFDWSWEASTDGGKTWKVTWPIHYVRRKDSTSRP